MAQADIAKRTNARPKRVLARLRVCLEHRSA
jgi:hypothetical protein